MQLLMLQSLVPYAEYFTRVAEIPGKDIDSMILKK